MNGAMDLIEKLVDGGCGVWVDDKDLKILAPPGFMKPVLLLQLKQERSAILKTIQTWFFRCLATPSRSSDPRPFVLWVIEERAGCTVRIK